MNQIITTLMSPYYQIALVDTQHLLIASKNFQQYLDIIAKYVWTGPQRNHMIERSQLSEQRFATVAEAYTHCADYIDAYSSICTRLERQSLFDGQRLREFFMRKLPESIERDLYHHFDIYTTPFSKIKNEANSLEQRLTSHKEDEVYAADDNDVRMHRKIPLKYPCRECG